MEWVVAGVGMNIGVDIDIGVVFDSIVVVVGRRIDISLYYTDYM